MSSRSGPEPLRDLERRLAEREQQLRTEIADKTREIADDTEQIASVQAIDDAERGIARTQRLLEQAERARDSAEVAEIQAARRRLQQGLYGRCIRCGEPIEPGRLLAQPAAARCGACQVEYERARGG